MAGNEWINGYLEAILDTGVAIDEHRSARLLGADKEALSAAKYFVNEVTGYDDAALYRTWIKASATKYPQERGSRMEYLCWRIWHIARKKKQKTNAMFEEFHECSAICAQQAIESQDNKLKQMGLSERLPFHLEWEDAQRLARRHLERQRVRNQTMEDMSAEDLSEGEKEKADAPPELAIATVSEDGSVRIARVDSWTEQRKDKRLYIVLLSLHGLVRGENMELGRDSDTGGQVKYVVELARALAMMPEVYRVDLLTRQICDPKVDWSYGEPTEMLSSGSYDSESQEIGESSGAYIVRIPFGPRDQYIWKEMLWPYIQEFVDGALAHILNMAKVLGEQIAGGEPVWPHVIHGHYADAGDSAALLSGALNVPMVLTGHSLGRNKLEQLLTQGRQSKEDINATYKIMRRIEAEELSLDAAELVITSTRQEIEQQWGLYHGFKVRVEKVLRARARQGVICHGRYMPRMVVIPPGMDFSNVVVSDAGDVVDGDLDSLVFSNAEGSVATPVSPRSEPPIWSEIMRFFSNPHKPMVLALARPDPKKNLTTLLTAFGKCKPLRELANLTLIMGNRDDIDEMSGGNANVLTTILKLIDKHDLYGQVAYPKHHKQADVPEIYRLAAKTKGVFINPALVEPFGLTLIEAAAHGLPMVATMNGGPVDIHRALGNGLLVDPHNQKEIADALLKLVRDRALWTECRKNGLKNINLYSWPEHCRTYLSRIAMCRMRHPQWQNNNAADGNTDIESQGDSLRDVRDISLRLSVDGEKFLTGDVVELEKAIKSDQGNFRDANGETFKSSSYKRSHSRFEPSNEAFEMKLYGNGNAEKPSNNSFLLRRRKRLAVIAVDSYDPTTGHPTKVLICLIEDIFKIMKFEASGRSTGFVLSTCSTLLETLAIINRTNVGLHEFDALICSSGSEIYYPNGHEEAVNGNTEIDTDYSAHIDYRWGGPGLRKTLASLTAGDGKDDGTKTERALTEDTERCNSHCLAYQVKKPSNAPSVDQIRQWLRVRGLRCHVMYCQNESRLHVLPLLASRSQALRYFFVRWGLDVANMYVFVGETGDTDYEELLSGTHKTIILKAAVTTGSEALLRAGGSYHRNDVAPAESPFIATSDSGCDADDLVTALAKLGGQPWH